MDDRTADSSLLEDMRSNNLALDLSATVNCIVYIRCSIDNSGYNVEDKLAYLSTGSSQPSELQYHDEPTTEMSVYYDQFSCVKTDGICVHSSNLVLITSEHLFRPILTTQLLDVRIVSLYMTIASLTANTHLVKK